MVNINMTKTCSGTDCTAAPPDYKHSLLCETEHECAVYGVNIKEAGDNFNTYRYAGYTKRYFDPNWTLEQRAAYLSGVYSREDYKC